MFKEKTIIEETLVASDYEVKTRIRSKIDPTKTILKYPGTYICPKCKNKPGTLKHGDTSSCKKCGLLITLFGNALFCRLEKE